MWYRLRRLLADASTAYVLTERAAEELLAEGHRPEPVGKEMEPPKVILCASAESLEVISDKKPVTVRRSADFLAARFVALVRFEDERHAK